jgi:hypothetical protein
MAVSLTFGTQTLYPHVDVELPGGAHLATSMQFEDLTEYGQPHYQVPKTVTTRGVSQLASQNITTQTKPVS